MFIRYEKDSTKVIIFNIIYIVWKFGILLLWFGCFSLVYN